MGKLTSLDRPRFINGTVTTFTVEPRAAGRHAQVTITTELGGRTGVVDALERWFVTRLLHPVYVKELALLAMAAGASPHPEAQNGEAEIIAFLEALAEGEDMRACQQVAGRGARSRDTIAPLTYKQAKGRTMKVGRNDPCPCGSGKKYKKCCLAKDEAAARQAAQERAAALRAVEPHSGGEPFAGFPSYTLPPPPEPRPRSPEEAAREELWEVFEAADAAEQHALFRRAMADGLLNDEYAFEMLAQLRDKGDHALCGTLLEELQAAHPDLYAQSVPYYLEWQIADALAAGQLDHLPELADALAATAGDDLDQFYRSRDRLAYHGHLALLADTMARAWPLVRASDKYLPGVDEEFAAEAQQIAMLAYLERTPAPRADDPALLAALEQFAMRDIGKLVEQAEPIWVQHPSDPTLGPNIRAAWAISAEA